MSNKQHYFRTILPKNTELPTASDDMQEIAGQLNML